MYACVYTDWNGKKALESLPKYLEFTIASVNGFSIIFIENSDGSEHFKDSEILYLNNNRPKISFKNFFIAKSSSEHESVSEKAYDSRDNYPEIMEPKQQPINYKT